MSGSVEAAGLAALLNLDSHVLQQADAAKRLSAPNAEPETAVLPPVAPRAAAAAVAASPPPQRARAVAPGPVGKHAPLSLQDPLADGSLGRIGPHVLRDAVDHDGLGRQFRAWDSQTGTDVAITVLDLEIDAKRRDQIIDKLQQGVMAAVPLVHPGLARIYDAGVIGEGVYIATEWLPGRSLALVLRSGWQATAEVAASVVAQLADALSHVHARGVVHGGLNPSTVMLDADDKPKITGLGYACAAYASDLPSMDPLVNGAAPYLAPEQFQGGVVDARTDIHALGVLLYELLTGRRAYPGDTVPAIAQALLQHDPTPPHWLRPNLPERLSAIAMQALQRNPAARYAGAADMAAALKMWLKESDAASRAVPQALLAAKANKSRPDRKHRWAPAGLLLAAVAAVALTWAERSELRIWPAAGVSAGQTAPVAAPAQTPAGRSAVAPPTAPPAPLSLDAFARAFGSAQSPSTAADQQPKTAEPVSSQQPAAARPREPALPNPPGVAAAKSSGRKSAIETPLAAPVMGTVNLAITPWGYVEVAGRQAGATPPLNALSLPAGTHTLTVRNQDFPPFVATVEVSADKVTTLRHRFER